MSTLVLHWPQLLYAGLILFGMGNAYAKYGQQKTDSYDLGDVIFGPAIVIVILYFGGFWTGGN